MPPKPLGKGGIFHFCLSMIKPFKTYDQQAELLISRGLENKSIKPQLIQRLKAVGYYRLSGYLYPFRRTATIHGKQFKLDIFRTGAKLTTVWNYYLFDRRLRFLIMDAIERVEIAFRVCLAYEWAKSTSMSNPQSLKGNFAKKYRNRPQADRLKLFQANYERSLEDFAFHFREDEGIIKVEDLPVWVFVQFSTFGNLHNLYKDGLPLKLRQTISHFFGFQDEAFFSSLIALLVAARNICAHHGRLWNRKWKYDTQNPLHPLHSRLADIAKDSTNPYWDSSQRGNFDKGKTAFLLTALHVLLQYAANTSQWDKRLITLLKESAPGAGIVAEMGFPKNWKHHPLWNQLFK